MFWTNVRVVNFSIQFCVFCFISVSFFVGRAGLFQISPFVLIIFYFFCNILFLTGGDLAEPRTNSLLIVCSFLLSMLWGPLCTDGVPYVIMGFIDQISHVFPPSSSSLLCVPRNFCKRSSVEKGRFLFVDQPLSPIWICYW